jgi:hypothetical protein
MTTLSGNALLNTEERRGFGAMIAVGSLLGMLAATILMSIIDKRPATDAAVVVACTVLGGLAMWPFARRESRVWVNRRRSRDGQ